MTIPFVGETPTGGERTKFLPRSSKDYFKPHQVPHNHPYSWYQRPTIVGWRCQEYKTHPVPKGWSRTKDTYCDSSRPRQIRRRSSYKARTGVEQRNKRSRHTPGNQRCQTANDSKTSSQAPHQRGAEHKEGRTSNRRSHKGSALSGFSACFTKLSYSLGVVGPESSKPSGRAGESVPFPCLHSAKAGKRDRIWKAFYSEPQSKWFPYCSRAGIRQNCFQFNSISSYFNTVCRKISLYRITQQCSTTHIIWNSVRTAPILPLPRSDISYM